MLPAVSKKTNFLEFLALLHYVSSWKEAGFESRFFSWADIVQKYEKFKKIIYLEAASNQTRGASHSK